MPMPVIKKRLSLYWQIKDAVHLSNIDNNMFRLEWFWQYCTCKAVL